MTKKQTPLTYELFQELIMPEIRKMISDVRIEFSRLPTKEEYFAREDKTMGELKKLREEVASVNDLYEKTNKRVTKIDKHLGIDTSVVF